MIAQRAELEGPQWSAAVNLFLKEEDDVDIHIRLWRLDACPEFSPLALWVLG